jgi:hypothetical protein
MIKPNCGRPRLMFDYNGTMYSIDVLAQIYGIKKSTLRHRLVVAKIPVEHAVMKKLPSEYLKKPRHGKNSDLA